jgi:hypothetical protein
LFDKAWTDIAHCIAMTVQGSGHMLIGPVWPVGIHVEQDVGMLDFIGRSLPALGQLYEFLSFVVCEAQNRGLAHLDTSIPSHDGEWRYRHETRIAKNENERILAYSQK